MDCLPPKSCLKKPMPDLTWLFITQSPFFLPFTSTLIRSIMFNHGLDFLSSSSALDSTLSTQLKSLSLSSLAKSQDHYFILIQCDHSAAFDAVYSLPLDIVTLEDLSAIVPFWFFSYNSDSSFSFSFSGTPSTSLPFFLASSLIFSCLGKHCLWGGDLQISHS